MLSRRDLVGKLAAGTAVLCAAGAARASLTSARHEANPPAGSGPGDAPRANGSDLPPTMVGEGPAATLHAPQPWELLYPLTLGTVMASGWRLSGFTGVVDGSCVATLENERGRAHRVHICRNDGSPQGLVYTSRFDLLVMNGGRGDLPTEEGFAQAVAEMAHALAGNEAHHEHVVTALLPQAERVRRFSGPIDRRLR